MNYIAIADVHGCLGHAQRLVKRLRKEGYLSSRRLVFLGDYIDRGPEIRRLIRYCMELEQEGHIFLRGNHEEGLLMAMHAIEHREIWARAWYSMFGGKATAESYKIHDRYFSRNYANGVRRLWEKMSENERAFITGLRYYFETPTQLFIHADVKADQPWPAQRLELDNHDYRTDEMPYQLEGREYQGIPWGLKGKCTISGHTPILQQYVFRRRVILDRGAFCYGKLAAWIPDLKEMWIADDDSTYLEPLVRHRRRKS